jgi:hypothetical protein
VLGIYRPGTILAHSHLPLLGRREDFMIMNRSLGLFGTLALVIGSLVVFTACSEDKEMSVTPMGPDGVATKVSRQAHLWLSFENVESAYVDADENPWITESWVTEQGAFDLVVQNNAKFATHDVVLLVTIPSKIFELPGWSVFIDGNLLDPAGFIQTNPADYGFDGGSHGVYRPSGNGIFYPYPLTATLAKKGSISVPVLISSGGVPGFMVHFDVGSSDLYNPASHDATVNPPEGPVSQPGACCFAEGVCEMMLQTDCETFGGAFQGEGISCDADPCPLPPAPGACCIPGNVCVEVLAADCDLQGGTFHGEGSVCTPDLCLPPPAPGACCLPDGSCTEILLTECDQQNGIFHGDGTLCATESCVE